MTRIVIMAGLGGAGTTSLVDATVRDARSTGASVWSIDVAEPQRSLAPDLRALVSATIGSLAVASGADRLAPEAWASLPGMRNLAVLDEIRRACLDEDVVVVDAGSLVTLRELLELPHVLLRLLDASLTPRSAMARPDSVALFDALSEARLQVLHLQSVLTSDSTSVRLVGRAADDGVESVVAAAGISSLLGVTVDGVILSRFPRRKDGDSDRVRKQARRVEGALQAALPHVPVWRSSDRPRSAPKGCALLDVLAPANAVAPLGEPVASGDGYLWDLRMPSEVAQRVRAGTQGGSLVLEYRGMHRWLDLPAVLKRCVAVDGERAETGLALRWEPDADVWPRVDREERGVDG